MDSILRGVEIHQVAIKQQWKDTNIITTENRHVLQKCLPQRCRTRRRRYLGR